MYARNTEERGRNGGRGYTQCPMILVDKNFTSQLKFRYTHPMSSYHNIPIVAERVRTYGLAYVARHLGFTEEQIQAAITQQDPGIAADVWSAFLRDPLERRSGRPRSSLLLDERHKLLDIIGDKYFLALHTIGLSDMTLMKALAGKEINLSDLQRIRKHLEAR